MSIERWQIDSSDLKGSIKIMAKNELTPNGWEEFYDIDNISGTYRLRNKHGNLLPNIADTIFLPNLVQRQDLNKIFISSFDNKIYELDAGTLNVNNIYSSPVDNGKFLSAFTMNEYQGQLYVAGGIFDNDINQPSGKVYRWNSNGWVVDSNLPYILGREVRHLAVYNNEMFLVASVVVLKYNTSSATWTQDNAQGANLKTNIYEAKNNRSSVQVGNKVFMFTSEGVSQNSGVTNGFVIYDLDSKSVKTSSELGISTANDVAVGVINGKPIISFMLKTFWYDIDNDAWVEMLANVNNIDLVHLVLEFDGGVGFAGPIENGSLSVSPDEFIFKWFGSDELKTIRKI